MAIHAPLRVAQVVEALESGGAELLAIEIARALNERHYDSHIIVLRGGGAFEGRLPAGVRYHCLERPCRDGGQFARLAYFAGTCAKLRALLGRLQIDLVQCHLPKANYLGLAMSAVGACPVCPTVHNNREFDYGDDASALKRRLRQAGYRQMLRTCPAVIAVSDRVRTSLIAELAISERDAVRVAVVPNGVEIGEPLDTAIRARQRAALGVGEDDLLLVAVGRLTRQKNHGALVRALAQLGPTRHEWRCVIAGEGELRDDLQRLICDVGLNSRVHLVGLVGEVRALMCAADVFCLPSLYEGLPLALLEAMAEGLPTVAYAIDGVRDVIVDGQHGIMAVEGDVAGFAAAVARLANDDDMRMRAGRAARDLARSRFSFSAVVDRLEEVYRTAMAGRGNLQ